MFGKLGDIGSLMRQLPEMRKRIEQMQKDLAQVECKGSAGGGKVTVVVDGRFHVKSVHIAPDCLSPGDAEIVEDMVRAAVNSAMESAQEEARKKMSGLTGGLSVPGLF